VGAAAAAGALDLIRPLLANEPDVHYPLLRLVSSAASAEEETALVWAAGVLGVRGVLVDVNAINVYNQSSNPTPLVAWNPEALLAYEGLHVFLTPVGRIIQWAEDRAIAAKINSRAATSVADAVLEQVDPRAQYYGPWLEPMRHMLDTCATASTASASGTSYAGPARLTFQWDAAARVLSFPEVLLRARQAVLADLALLVLWEVGWHLGAAHIRVPMDCGLYTQCSHPETSFVEMSEAEERAAMRNGGGGMRTLRPLPQIASVALLSPPAPQRREEAKLLDALRFGDALPATPLPMSLALADQLAMMNDAPAFPKWAAEAIAPGKDDDGMRHRRVVELWLYLLSMQVVEPPARRRALTVERGVAYGWDNGSLPILVFQPNRHDVRELRGDDDDSRPFRWLRIEDYRHPLAHSQPAVAPEVVTDLYVLALVVGRFLRHNRRLERTDRYRLAITISGTLHAWVQDTLVPRLPASLREETREEETRWRTMRAFGAEQYRVITAQ
jgi:hypothetical protein